MRGETASITGLWLTCGGLALLAARHVAGLTGFGAAIDGSILSIATLAAYVAMGAGLCLAFGGRTTPTAPAPPIIPDPAALEPRGRHDEATAARIVETILNWADLADADKSLWRSFDQLVRELLVEFAGASRVRLFVPRSGRLVPFGPDGEPRTGDEGETSHDPLLDQVAASGRPHFDPTPERAPADTVEAPRWAWVIPVQRRGRLLGLIAAGRIDPLAPPEPARRDLLAAVLAWLWDYTCTLEELHRTRPIDKATGVLTRTDFFERAAAALEESYATHEPVVMLAIGLEGMRRLDDEGRWDERDAIIEALGREIRSKMRSDDIIGRFSDDRFVILLRRLDRGLGRLIAAKAIQAVGAFLDRNADRWPEIRVRAGVAGGSPEPVGLEALLVAALNAIDQARQRGIELAEAEAIAPAAREAKV